MTKLFPILLFAASVASSLSSLAQSISFSATPPPGNIVILSTPQDNGSTFAIARTVGPAGTSAQSRLTAFTFSTGSSNGTLAGVVLKVDAAGAAASASRGQISLALVKNTTANTPTNGTVVYNQSFSATSAFPAGQFATFALGQNITLDANSHYHIELWFDGVNAANGPLQFARNQDAAMNGDGIALFERLGTANNSGSFPAGASLAPTSNSDARNPHFYLVSQTDTPPPPAHGRLNVVVFLIDDLSHKPIGVYGGRNFETPRIDALAAGGMRFDRAFTTPLCTPTRVAMMSGKHNGRNYVEGTLMPEPVVTFANVLRDAGYATAVTGKWKIFKSPLTDWAGYISRMGFDEHCVSQYRSAAGERYRNPTLGINGREVAFNNGEYGPDITLDYALDFIDRNKNKPFLLYYPSILVHDPIEPTPDDPEYGVFLGEADRFFPSMVKYMDKEVGRIIDKLAELGLREQTLVIITADNGTKQAFTTNLGGGVTYPGGKGKTDDSGTHVPLIVNQPGTVPAGVNDDLVDLTDVFPTLCEAAGIPISPNIVLDGKSFSSAARGIDAEKRDHIFQWYRNNPQDPLIEYAFNKTHKLYRTGQFYNLGTDLFETTPLNVNGLTGAALTAYTHLQGVLNSTAFVASTGVAASMGLDNLLPGEDVPILAQPVPANSTRRDLAWSTRNPAVATVNKWGVVKAFGAGRTAIRATTFEGPDFTEIPVTVGNTRFNAWQMEHFDDAQLAQPTISGAAADFDGDKLPTSFEFAFDLNPKSGKSTSNYLNLQTAGASLRMGYRIPPGREGISYTPKWSRDLVSWFSGSSYIRTVSETPRDGGTEVVVETVPTIESKPKQFMQMELDGLPQ